MTKKVKYLFIISVISLIASTIGLFSADKLYSPIVWFLSINSLIAGIAIIHLKRTNSARVFGGYLVGVMIIYNWRNYEPNWGIESIFYFGYEHLNYSVRTTLTLMLTGYGISQLILGGQFAQLRGRKTFLISLILISVFLFTEIPIFDIHGDFGGSLHGHNYLKRFHFH